MNRSASYPQIRLIRIILLLALFLLCLLSAVRHPWIRYADCLKNPTAYEGKVVTHFHEPVIGRLYEDGFELLQKNLPPVRVLAEPAGLSEGEFVALSAVFHQGRPLTALSLEMAEKRREKMAVSVLPVLLLPFLWFRHFRWNRKKSTWEIRNNA